MSAAARFSGSTTARRLSRGSGIAGSGNSSCPGSMFSLGAAPRLETHTGAYPERLDSRPTMLDRWVRRVTGPVLRRLSGWQVRPGALIRAVAAAEAELQQLDEHQLRYAALA